MDEDQYQDEAPNVPAAPEPEKRTPHEWAERLGQYKKASPYMPQLRSHYGWKHAAADSLHGWSLHAHHYQSEPLLLTEADYKAALEAAAEYPLKPAHAAALGKTKQKEHA